MKAKDIYGSDGIVKEIYHQLHPDPNDMGSQYRHMRTSIEILCHKFPSLDKPAQARARETILNLEERLAEWKKAHPAGRYRRSEGDPIS